MVSANRSKLDTMETVQSYQRPEEKPPGGTRTRFGASGFAGSGTTLSEGFEDESCFTSAGCGASVGVDCPFEVGASVPLVGLNSSP